MPMRRIGAATLAALLAVTGAVVASSAAHALPPLGLQPVASVTEPLYVTHAGDSRLFVVQRNGAILILDPEQGILPTPFLDISGLVDEAGDGGLFTIAFHPDYGTTSDFFFVSYTETGTGGGPLDSIIARYEVSSHPNVADSTSRAELIRYSEPGTSHNTAQIAFGPDGFLYIGTGDGGTLQDPDCRAQHGDDFHGKVLRVDVDENVGSPPFYGIPAGNPFAGGGDGILDEIWATGLRHPWRFSFDADGNLWLGDVGQNRKEEIDRQLAASIGGENYGWRIMEGTSCHDPDPIDPDCPAGTPSCFSPSYTDPIFDYDTGDNCAIVGGFVYGGNAISGLPGLYVFGDVCSALMWALEGAPGSFTRTPIADGSFSSEFLTSFGEDVDGELYVMLGDGVYRLVQQAVVPALGPAGLAILALALAATAVLTRSR
jgi:glucose/arabinose dehydrogenase